VDADREQRIQVIGRELFAHARAQAPRTFSRSWFDDLVMAWTMRDEPLKVQLFRFVDALPGLRDDGAVSRHLAEYLGTVAGRLPAPARFAVGHLDNRMVASLVAAAARFGARQLARKFISGADLAEAAATIRRLRRDGLAFTIDLLGEAILSDSEADRYQASYLELVDGLGAEAARWADDDRTDGPATARVPKVNISIKLSALSSRWDPCDPVGSSREVRGRLRPILRRAQRQGAYVNVDMESHAYKNLTLRILREVLDEDEFRSWPDVGVAIQAYLRSCADDLAGLHDWAEQRGTPLGVRLVKGAYWDYERVIAAQNGWPVPVFTGKADSDANFERLTVFLLDRRAVLPPVFGSHNVRSIAHALAQAEARGIARGQLEFQMLYGMADPLKQAVRALGCRLRVYTPYGQLLPGMAYLVRRLLENTSNTSFVRAGFLEHLSEEHLLMAPSTTPEPPAVPPPPRTPLPPFVNEPPADFSHAEVRAAMAAALAAERAPIACPLIIAGVAVTTGRVLASRNPSTSTEVVGEQQVAAREHVERAVAAAQAAFPAWRDAGVAVRAAALEQVADRLLTERWTLAALIVREAGKSWREADAEVIEAVDFCRFYAAEARRLAVPRRRDVAGEHNEQVYEPRGVCAVIAPWNFPLAILGGMAAAAMVTGNTVIMKPAEQTPAVALRLLQAFAAAVPPGVVNYLPGLGEEVGAALVEHASVSVIAFTGSRAVGLAINRAAAAVAAGEVKRVITEMGGKNAIIIDADADLDEAVHGTLWSAFGYQGQKCSACSRAIVVGAVYDSVLARLVEACRSLSIGSAEDPGAAIGPVIDAEAQARILAAIAAGRGEARLAYAGELPPGLAGRGWHVAPHVFADVPPRSHLAQDEIFGPVLAVMRADDLDHALAIANDTPYALTGGFYSRSPQAIDRVRRGFRVGNLYINRKITGAVVDRQPFGGFKLSGIGSKAGGADYLLQFLVPRVITENTLRHGFTAE